MNTQLKISARNAGQVELEKYCPRCCWYLLNLKRMPFQIGMPGLIFYAEQAEKAILLAYLEEHGSLPKNLGPFSDCTEPIDFPPVMETEHEGTGVLLTARPDMIFRNASGKLSLVDLKTSKPDGGGKVFLPQYEIQVIGYTYVVEANNIGKVRKTGLIYGDVQIEEFKLEPLKFATKEGFQLPFKFQAHEVELDYSRLTRCLKEVNKVWNEDRPPEGADNCKDCKLLARLISFDNELRDKDQWKRPLGCAGVIAQDSYRRQVQPSAKQIAEILSGNALDYEGGMWASWVFE